MLKINGQRVEPGEIEAMINAIPGVETAVVKGFENEYGQSYMCAYYKETEPVSPEEVRAELLKRVPPYMVPLFIEKIEQFPLNSNGKLDRKSLTSPDITKYRGQYIKPENKIQELICNGFSSVLKQDSIGIDDDFFALGGDSIRGIMLQKACAEIDLMAEDILMGRTPRIMALLCENRRKDNREDPFEGCSGEKPFYPMTDSQLGVFLECVENPTATMYNIPMSFFISHDVKLDQDKFIAYVKKAVESFPSLKTVAAYRDGTPVMIPRADMEVAVPTIKMSESDLKKAKRDFVKPFQLEEGPLFRFTVYETEEGFHFLMDIHHMIFDGSSTEVFLRQIAHFYQDEEALREEVNSFAVANYEEKFAGTPAYEENRKYFDKMLSGIEVDSNLIFDKEEGNKAEKQEQADKPSENIRIALTGKIEADSIAPFLKQNSITENTLFMGAFSYCLAKFTGQDESLFCTVGHGRFHRKLNNTVGMLVRTLPVYTKFNEEERIADYLLRLQNDFYTTLKNQAYSFGEMARNYGLKSDILYVYQNEMLNGFKLGGHTIPLENIETGSSLANLSLMIFKRETGYEMSLNYRSDLYRENTVRRFAGMLVMILKGFLQNTTLREIQLVTEQDVLLREKFNDNKLEFDRSLTVIDLFRQQAAQNPDHTAIVFKDRSLTYKELDDLSEALAVHLKKKGVGPEKPVGILINRSEIFPVCFLGILKAGGAYQPLDPQYPKERLLYMMEDSRMEILIADRELKEIAAGFKGEIIDTNDIYALSLDRTVQLESPKPRDLFILLYTSGSTGMPKGCMLEHRNLLNFCRVFQEMYSVTENDRSVAYASFGFDASMMDFYPYLTKGASVYIIPEEMRLDIIELDAYFRKNKITNFFITTQLGRQYVTEYPDNPYIRAALTGGEKLTSCDPPSYRFENLYGPTECTIFVTSFTVDKKYANIPIGRSFGNTDIYIADKYNRELPVGVPGELCIAGYPVARGYLNRDDLTGKVFVENPFSSKTGYERIYKTGDICRYLEDGNIEFAGRRDFQVKIRGFRIELSEIEARIRRFPGIKDATVIAKDGPDGGKFVAAYITGEAEIDISGLNEFIMEELPYYMVPAAIMQIERIPLNQNGKVDKKKLPEPQFGSGGREEETSRPLTYLEETLLGIVGEIVGHKSIDINLNLMRAGLTSLSAIKLATTIQKVFGYTPTVKKMMQGTTILELENEIQKYLLEKVMLSPQEAGEADQNLMGRALIHSQTDYLLSPTQMGVYYDYMKRPREIIYNIPVMLKMSGKISPERLIAALEEVVNAHPYLQTRLKMEGAEVRQFRSDEAEVNIDHIKIEESSIPLFRKEFPRPFDILQEPLYRMTVAETEDNVYLFADFHHIIFDGTSLRIFLQELGKAYDEEKLRPEQYSYFNYVQDEIRKENTPSYKEAEEYFASKFKDFAGTSEIPADLNGKMEEGKLAEAVYLMDKSKIDSYCGDNAITPAHLFFGGAAYAISRFAGSRDIHICTISSGRSDLNIQNSLGMFVRTLPLSLQINGELTGRAFIQGAKDVFMKAIDYEDFPFPKIAAQYGFAPQIMYACQLGIMDEKIQLGGEELLIEEITPQIPKFKISVHIKEINGRIGVCVQYNDALYTGRTMETFAEALGMAVENLVERPENLLKHTSIVSKKQADILKIFNSEPGAEIGEKTLHQVFAKQAALYPNRKALIATDGEFTYDRLNSLMNRTANGLIKLGARPGERIAILLPRDSRMIIAMYGILKAGGAFIPCDTEYPVDRINYILEDSEASYIITTKERMKDFPTEQSVDIDTLLSCSDASAPQAEVNPWDLAYLIYTSGSTGKPKGVMLEHHGICNYVYNHPVNQHVHAAAEGASTMLSVTTVSFDMSLKETALALCNGLTLVLANEEEARNPVLLARLFAKTKADAFNATPSRMLEYMKLPAFCEALKNCKIIMAGGEKYPLKLLDKLQGLTKARLFNTYGPTEITVSSNCRELTNENDISIGRPLLNYIEYIVDQDGNELPPGVTGELYIGGPGVARGYQNLDSQTKEMFVEYKGQRVYKSGDYAKWSEQGDVLLLGRKDNQIKLRGLRIELGEIESRIARYQHIGNAVVVIRKLNGTEHLCAYYTGDEAVNAENLRESLKNELPDYMVPTAYMQLPALPVTPNGKTDLKALPDPFMAAGDDYEEPATKAEKLFCDIFAKVLELPRVGAADNFFDKGGTSLVVTRVIIEAAKYEFEITYGDVFAYPTPRELAKALSNNEDKEKEIRDPSLEDLAGYDYSNINKVLAENNLEQFKQGKRIALGNILLTGATGFLGIHVLEEFLQTQNGIAYCLLRDARSLSAVKRLKAMLYYYFENSHEELFGKRIIVLNGDITKPESFTPIEDLPVDTVINCAANVKHFSQGSDIEDVNVGGVLNIIAYCQKTSARLIHVSTTSVSGFSIDGSPSPENTLNEQMLYLGQNLDTKYGHSKFRAERFILEKISSGLKAKIMRVGNLSARDSDGEFQINFTTNSFMGRLKSYLLIGKFPYELMNQQVEFSPIDYTAASILRLAESPDKCCVFHNYNNHTVAMGDIIRQMNHMGLHIEVAETEEYEETLKKAEDDPEKAKTLSSMIAYRNMGHGRKISSVPRTNEYTLQALYRLGYQWPITSGGYMEKFLLSLQGLGYFDLD